MEKIEARLEQRDKDRKAKLEEKQEIRNRDASKSEGIEYFEVTFNEKVREIQNNLNNLEQGDTNLPSTFTKIGTSLQELQRYLSSSTFFLNDRKVQKCQETLKGLTALLEERKSKLIPKKKFGFRNKTLVVAKDAQITSADDTDASATTKKLFDYSVHDKSNEIISFKGSDANEKDLTVANLDACLLDIEGHPGSLHLKNIQNCLIISGPVSRSIFVENCKNTTFQIACQQLRLHSSRECDIYLHVTSRGIIEDSSEIRVAPYSLNYDGISQDWIESKLPHDRNNWNDIADFNWLSAEQKSPNWNVIEEAKRVVDWDSYVTEWKEKHMKS
ncbi:tubulin-specific chaperone C [Culicoides brevitarsis]|uniref:tubulin-specific chaperone C n=1 Tax=Culicoides brevitarsis TaxID=469753 RepID=UPI00307CAEB1